jgi:NAD(P)-dependent dehydrogenase (short-subunit alcohol dehydrogenase family)
MVILITGACGGLGRVLGRTLLDKGETVYGTSRSAVARAEEVPFPLLDLDVASQASVDACLAALVEREGRIDVIVNCVNEMIIGAVEETDVEEVKALFDTNLFGVMRLCRTAAGIMRGQGGGTIVNMSSLGGLLAVPLMSAYTSAKFALEAFSEALYHELKPHRIAVVIMQPVAMHMDRPAIGHHLRTAAGIADDSPSHRMVRRMAKDTAASRLTPEMVSEKIYAVITADSKPLRVPMDRARVLGLVKRLAPQSLINRLVAGVVDLSPSTPGD